MSAWAGKRYWIATIMALFTAVPIILLYAYIGGKGLSLICAADHSAWHFICKASIGCFFIVMLVLSRFFLSLAETEGLMGGAEP